MSKPASMVKVFVCAIVVLCSLGMVSVTAILLLAPASSEQITTILGFLVPIIGVLLGGAIYHVHHTFNGRMDQLLKLTGDLRYAAGREDQRIEEHEEREDHEQE